ncbi:MAG: GGDEF domain-containing protein [Mariprofundaceae bacterium]
MNTSSHHKESALEIDQPEAIHINTLAADILQRFRNDKSINSLAVVNDEQLVLGLVTRRNTLAVFGHQFAHDLNKGKGVEILMDENPASFDINTDIDMMSRSMTEREAICHFDPAIITCNGIYHGLLSIITLLKSITDIRLQQAYDCNPLSRLPGNNSINREIDFRLQNHIDFTMVYADLDSFKAFNDCYGYERGDRVIQMVAKILSNEISPKDFLGHVGGDDFVLILEPEKWREKLELILTIFAAESAMMYRQEDRQRGYIVAEDRLGEERQFDLMSLSLAVIPCQPKSFVSHISVAEVASEVKHQAKNVRGNSIAINRRTQ